MTTDPVCKMQVDPESGIPSADHAGAPYYFCSEHCREKFLVNPTAYLEPVGAAVPETGMYSCPMHPEVRQSSPGVCPKCGMVLESGPPDAAGTGIAKPLQFGTGAFVLLLAIYFGVVGLISGMDFALEQFETFWYFIVPLAMGFGIQVGLYTHLKGLVGRQGGSGKVVAVSGTTSTAAMVSCCAHYLANIVPILGGAGFLTVVAEYQVELFWVGLVFNAAGIEYVASMVIKTSKEHKKCANNS